MANTASPWTLEGTAASLRLDAFSASVKIDQPGLGIHAVSWDGKPIAAVQRWLGFIEPGPLPSERIRTIEDAYVRGRDLVVVYAETKDHPLRYVLYWRTLGEEQLCGAAAGLDVVVSVQTSLLDAEPTALLSSQCRVDQAWASSPPERVWTTIRAQAIPARSLDNNERLRMGEHMATGARASRDDAFLFELAESPWTHAEMIHPRDRRLSHAVIEDDPCTAVRVAETCHGVFGRPLEKGVLLRARLRALLLPRSGAQDVALWSRDRFERAELPLTT